MIVFWLCFGCIQLYFDVFWLQHLKAFPLYLVVFWLYFLPAPALKGASTQHETAPPDPFVSETAAMPHHLAKGG